MNIRIVVYIVGWVLTLEGGFMLLPAATGFLWHEAPHSFVYLAVGAACVVLGLLLRLRKPTSRTFYAREGFVTVALSWIVLSLMGALPFTLTGDIPSYVDALFEIISGFTTTGSSILRDVEALSHANLIWRSFSHWIGGMGVLVFVLAVLPMTGGSSLNLMKAESPGPSVGKLVPKIRRTALLLYQIYMIMTFIQILILLVGRMPLFDTLCLTFGTAGTGGFGVLGDSIASYSAFQQNTITVFMFLFGVNFSFYYMLLIRKPDEALKMEEVRWYFGIYAAAVLLITLNLTRSGEAGGIMRHFQDAAFQVSSIMTTTGYATADFDKWPMFSRGILVLLMFIGACAGSTGGGIKVSRIVLYFKQIGREVRRQIHPRTVKVLLMDGKPMDRDMLHSCNVFLLAYFVIFALSALLLTLDGFDPTTTFTAVAATLNNIGPGLAKVGPVENFADFSALSKFVMMFDMLAGRLEIIPMLVLFHPRAWKR
ncbi:MAG: TrkH family potassium uptake protein [Oscillospiraceae bacterium]|nr:TrkH family potassium uptake protein [Oscillospiraceae bacterium]